MDEYDFDSHQRSQKHKARRQYEDKFQYLLSAEEQLLDSISAHAPLPEVLNGICSALDCQIGNVVSLISLPGDDETELTAIAMNASLFGLYTFWSESVLAGNDEVLGSLEIYCSVPRSPSVSEFQLIERAKCLAALAIKRNQETDRHGNGRTRGIRRMRGPLSEWPVSMN